jgi:hypothetical protein
VHEQAFERELARLRREELPKLQEELARSAAHAEIDASLRQLEIVAAEYVRFSDLYRNGSSHAVRMNALEEMTELLAQHTAILNGLLEQPREHLRSHKGLRAFANR